MKKLLTLTKNVAAINFGEIALPFRITYIVTSRCQLKCSMCSIWKKPLADELRLDEIERFFSQAHQFSWVNLSGGEIFLRNDLLAIIRTIAAHCKNLYLLDFPTNGFATATIAEKIQEIIAIKTIPKIFVTVSIDGPQETHDTIRGVPGSWEKAVATFEGLRKLRNSRFQVFFGFTLQPANMKLFDATFDTINKKIGGLHHNDFHINVVQHSSHYYCNDKVLKQEEDQALWQALHRIMQLRKTSLLNPVAFLEQRYQRLAQRYLATHRSPLSCQALCSSCFMDPCGTVYPCSIYNQSIGNIRDFDYNLGKLWKAECRIRIRKEIKQGICPHCWTPCEAYQTILGNLFKHKKCER